MISAHAFAIHFPVAFLLVSTIVYFLWLVTRREVYIPLFVVTLTLGVVGLGAAVITGSFRIDAQITNGGFVDVFERHENLAYFILSVFYGVFVWYIVRRKKMQKSEQWLLFAVQLVATGIMLYTAHLGGELVYKHGAGVEPVRHMQR